MSGGERAGVETMTVKVGERIWMGPFDVVGMVGDKPILGGSSHDEREKIPHSDALPAVARWLVSLPQSAELNGSMEGVAEHVKIAFEQYFRNNVFTRDCGTSKELQAMRALAEALTGGGEGAGGG